MRIVIFICSALLCFAQSKNEAPKITYGWKSPEMPLLPPPRTMGKQMGRVQTLGVPNMGYELDGNVKVFTLILQPVEHVLTDGTGEAVKVDPYSNVHFPTEMPSIPVKKTGKLWGINGSVPGPTIEVTEGDTVRLHVINNLPEPSSLHWHGIELPNKEDGSADTTQGAIMPGESHTYEFTLHQSGTCMYHASFNDLKQVGMGLGGMFVIHPKKENKKIDKDFAFLMMNFNFPEGSDTPDILSMGRNWFTMNAKVYPSIPPMMVRQGERVRIRLANLSNMDHPIHLHGYTFMIVGTDGGPIQPSAQWPAVTCSIQPGQTREIELVAWNPGLWRFHCHNLHHLVNNYQIFEKMPVGILPLGGMFTYFHVEPTKPGEKWTFPKKKEDRY